MKPRQGIILPLLSLAALALPGMSHADTQLTTHTSIPNYLLVTDEFFRPASSRTLRLSYDVNSNTFSTAYPIFAFTSSNNNSFVKFRLVSGDALVGAKTGNKIPLKFWFHSDHYEALNVVMTKAGDAGEIAQKYMNWNPNTRRSNGYTLEITTNNMTSNPARPAEDDYIAPVVMEFTQGT